MIPTVGRIVHVIEDGGFHLPAIITGLPGGLAVTLEVFGKENKDVRQFVTFDEHAKIVGTWHWPERE